MLRTECANTGSTGQGHHVTLPPGRGSVGPEDTIHVEAGAGCVEVIADAQSQLDPSSLKNISTGYKTGITSPLAPLRMILSPARQAKGLTFKGKSSPRSLPRNVVCCHSCMFVVYFLETNEELFEIIKIRSLVRVFSEVLQSPSPPPAKLCLYEDSFCS